MSMYIYESEGKSKAEAEEAALDALDAEDGELRFENITGNSGLLGLVSRKPAILRAYAEESLPNESVVRGIVLTIAAKMDLDAGVVDVDEKDGNLVVELESKDAGILIGKHGRTLDAIQFLVNLLMSQKWGEKRRIMLDIESYREKRQESLERLAKSAAQRASRSGESVVLDYMNPYERRLVHLALEEDDRVYTRSDGNGVYKRVRVIPAEFEGQEEEDDDYPDDD